MKKFILFLILLPLLSLSQERQQKQSIRQGTYSPSMGSRSPMGMQSQPRMGPNGSEYQQKQQFRENSRPKPGSNIPSGGLYYYDPYWNWNGGWGWDWGWGGNWRWQRWGAPIWFDNWYPWSYYDRWGYRQPARIYVTENGKTDTVRGVKQRLSFGIQMTNNQLGGFFTIGRKGYFLLEYQRHRVQDRSTFYPDLTRDVVIPWEDKRLPNITRGGTLFVGGGSRFGKTGIHAALGIGKERVRQQYFDELFILSNNGRYSIPDFHENFLTVKLGAMRDFKFATLKLDYEPFRDNFGIGLGVNF